MALPKDRDYARAMKNVFLWLVDLGEKGCTYTVTSSNDEETHIMKTTVSIVYHAENPLMSTINTFDIEYLPEAYEKSFKDVNFYSGYLWLRRFYDEIMEKK